MSLKRVHWINSPVLFEAIVRYEQGLLPGSMKLWVEQLLDLKLHKGNQLLPTNTPIKQNHPGSHF